MGVLKEINCKDNISNNFIFKISAKFDDEKGKPLNDVLKEILENSLRTENELIV